MSDSLAVTALRLPAPPTNARPGLQSPSRPRRGELRSPASQPTMPFPAPRRMKADSAEADFGPQSEPLFKQDSARRNLPSLQHRPSFRRVPDLCAVNLGEGRQPMLIRFDDTHDVSDFLTPYAQCVGDKRTMTAPRHRFRAHDACLSCFRQFEQLRKPFLELRRFHVVGEAAKAVVAPSRVSRVGTRLPESSQFGQSEVVDALDLECP